MVLQDAATHLVDSIFQRVAGRYRRLLVRITGICFVLNIGTVMPTFTHGNA